MFIISDCLVVRKKRFLINDSRSTGKSFRFSEVPENFMVSCNSFCVAHIYYFISFLHKHWTQQQHKSQFKGIRDGRRWNAITVNHITRDIWYLLIVLHIFIGIRLLRWHGFRKLKENLLVKQFWISWFS